MELEEHRCICGCGKLITWQPWYRKNGWAKYISGHNRHSHDLEARQRIADAHQGSKNPMWKGDKVGYSGIHGWVKRHFKRTNTCNRCREQNHRLDLANISGKYKRSLADWEWLCRRCHMIEDGRMKNLKQFQKKKVAKQ